MQQQQQHGKRRTQLNLLQGKRRISAYAVPATSEVCSPAVLSLFDYVDENKNFLSNARVVLS